MIKVFTTHSKVLFAHMFSVFIFEYFWAAKKASEYMYDQEIHHKHTLQTNPRHREEEPQNTDWHKTSGR